MEQKRKLKIIVDVLMTIGLLLLMCYQLIGEEAHEWIGVGEFILFFIHHILNWNWTKSIVKGKYNVYRTIQTILAFLVFIAMIGLMISGIILSRYAFDFLDIRGLRSFARSLHMLMSYWGFILMSLHIGIHWIMIINIFKKFKAVKFLKIIMRGISIFFAAYGIYAFIKREIISYLFLTVEFVFFDFEEPIIVFLFDYLAIMGLFIFIAYYIMKAIRQRSLKKYSSK